MDPSELPEGHFDFVDLTQEEQAADLTFNQVLALVNQKGFWIDFVFHCP